MAAAKPPAVKGKGKKGPFGLNPVLFWGGLGVLGLGVAYFIYKRNAAQQNAAQAQPQMLPVAVTGATGLTGAQLFTWLKDHQGPPHHKPKPKPPHKPPRKRHKKGDGGGDS